MEQDLFHESVWPAMRSSAVYEITFVLPHKTDNLPVRSPRHQS